ADELPICLTLPLTICACSPVKKAFGSFWAMRRRNAAPACSHLPESVVGSFVAGVGTGSELSVGELFEGGTSSGVLPDFVTFDGGSSLPVFDGLSVPLSPLPVYTKSFDEGFDGSPLAAKKINPPRRISINTPRIGAI